MSTDSNSNDSATTDAVQFTAKFWDNSPKGKAASRVFLKTVGGCVALLSLGIFAVFSIYWGSLWQSPDHPLQGWVVVSCTTSTAGWWGRSVSAALTATHPGHGGIHWNALSASNFRGGISQLEKDVSQEKVWYAVAINAGASQNLSTALASADGSYNSSNAITFIGNEASKREHILEAVTSEFALAFLKNTSLTGNLSQLLQNAPGLVSHPIYFTIHNLHPFDVPVAGAVTFVGLIYLMILAFFIVNASYVGRITSGLETRLCLDSIIHTRLNTAYVAYFILSLFYTLLCRAFQLPFERHYGHAGFIIFWLLHYLAMLACGLALEAALTPPYIQLRPLLPHILDHHQCRVCVFPIDALPHIYRYGIVFPAYNVSRGVRAIVFGTKNDLGINFAVQIVWVCISNASVPILQWRVRRCCEAESQSGSEKLPTAA
ncbi:DUF3533 domain-containing protein [Mycena indigotica]|uniref:DUF3533 domain-containing protein n=1 Tax=Mycena indigotica TaxID=2126181 RepID=A0A8H6S5L0_9AGAR|nr:DUF3533 domain-containing protein [Mycena indigotica]KAF7292242.1 DUF3533 domain-containing protein [Mycena indigotica]